MPQVIPEEEDEIVIQGMEIDNNHKNAMDLVTELIDDNINTYIDRSECW